MPEDEFTLLDLEGEDNSQNIIGTLKNIVYKNEINNFFVARLIVEKTGKQITIVGKHFEVNSGERIEITGSWEENSDYGRQFKVSGLKYLNPATIKGIERYLGSGLIKGVGPAIAKRIVSKFKLKTLEILDNNPDELKKVSGLGSKKINAIKKEWKRAAQLRESMIFFQTYGITTLQALKIFDRYGDKSINKVKSNPYRLIDDIFGIGFKKADSIAIKLGVKKDSIDRISSGIVYLLKSNNDNGNCYLPFEDLVSRSLELLETDRDRIDEAVDILIDQKKIVIVKNDNKSYPDVYLKHIYDAEKLTAKKLIHLFKSPHKIIDLGDERNTDRLIQEYAEHNDIFLDKVQLIAIRKAIMEKVLVITGSPGTGKSTILNIIIAILEDFKSKILLAAPTGRASKRMSETTGKEAKTIHRLLKYNPKNNKFLKNRKNLLDTDVLIIDEASMIDITLMGDLLEALRPSTKLILVGDVDQLPSVGPGNVLKDIIESNILPVVILDNIYRQGGNSKIISNAHKIRDGCYPELRNNDEDDFYFIESNNPEKALKILKYLINDKIPDTFLLDPVKDVQVIVPTNKGIIGVNNLNKVIQSIVNNRKESLKKGDMHYKINDKVIQLKNNYEKEVFNGDIGFICSIDDESQEIIIDFNGKKVSYYYYELDEISLAYAISIHKSQGSEFDCVVIPVLTSHYILLQRNLLYTALTRGKNISILIGSKKAIGIAVSKDDVQKRFTGLKELIIENADN